jgi:hypothetical protein
VAILAGLAMRSAGADQPDKTTHLEHKPLNDQLSLNAR